jgi:hypothetical protein
MFILVNTTVLLTFLVIMALGKFQGVIMPTTPIGCRMKIISLLGVGLWAT